VKKIIAVLVGAACTLGVLHAEEAPAPVPETQPQLQAYNRPAVQTEPHWVFCPWPAPDLPTEEESQTPPNTPTEADEPQSTFLKLLNESILVGLVANEAGHLIADALDIEPVEFMQFLFKARSKQQHVAQAEEFLERHAKKLVKIIKLAMVIAEHDAKVLPISVADIAEYTAQFANLETALAAANARGRKEQCVQELSIVAMLACLITASFLSEVCEWAHTAVRGDCCPGAIITECLRAGNDNRFAEFLCGNESEITQNALAINPACGSGIHAYYARLHELLARGVSFPFGDVMLAFVTGCKKFLAPLPALAQARLEQPCISFDAAAA
jgi:hypothetical protein